MPREFYLQDDKSNKFWTIEVVGNTCVTTNGRVGAQPRETRKDFDDEISAQRYAEKQITEKLGKGYTEGGLDSIPEYSKPNWAEMHMSEELFWRLIGLFNWKKLGDDEAVMKPAIDALSRMCVEDIERFEDIMSEKLYALDTEAHARGASGEETLSDDGFLYQRCCVVVNGREFFESVLANPKKMPQDADFEGLLYLATFAYEQKTGEEFDYSAPVNYETCSNAAGWQAVLAAEGPSD